MSWNTVVGHEIVDQYVQILTFPAAYPEFLPSIIPIFVGLVVLELYFDRYENETLGWNSAVSNATLIITTGLTLIVQHGILHPLSGSRAVVAYSVLAVGTLILLLNFYHRWPAELAFNVSSAFISYTIVYITIAVVYAGIPVSGHTLLAAGIVLVTVHVLFTSINHIR